MVVKWDGTWSNPASGGNTATTITASGISSLSDFAVGEVGADLTILKVGPTYATAGDPAGFDYVLTVHNAGPADNVTGFTVTDTLAGALTFQPLGSDGRCSSVGQVVTCTNVVGLADGADDLFVIHVTLRSAIPAGTVLTNTASVTTTGTNDPDTSNDTSIAATLVVVVPPAPTPTPTATASLADTRTAGPAIENLPVVSLIAAWAVLLLGLAVAGARRRAGRS